MLPLSEIFAAVRWWGVLLLLATAVLPLTWTLFRRLPDRGYAFARLVGLLLVSYTFWILGSLGILQNDLGSILIALLLVAGLSFWAYRREQQGANREFVKEGSPGSLLQWLREHWRQVLLTEILFLAIFALWIGVRAQNPAITATEKPMEFAFLNAAGRTPTMPPLDPWLSGFAISYYYFGYVMVSVLARLAAVPEYIAFNLGIAWLVAGTAVAAFGLVYNLVMEMNRNGTARGQAKGTAGETGRGVRRQGLAVTLGLIAALALPIAGNQQITMELLHANGVGSESFWQWLDVRDLNRAPNPEQTPRYESSAWWWWRSSRVIHEYHLSGRAEEGLEPIVEFPGFSFVLGDMHPHVLALPFAFLSLAVAYLWFLESGNWPLIAGDDTVVPGAQAWLSNLRALIKQPLWLFTAVLLGGLSFLNTWDVLIHLFVVLGAYALARWRQEGWQARRLTEAFLLAVSLVLALVLLYLPFYLGFKSQAGAPYLLPMLMRPTRLVHFLIIFGMPLSALTVLLLTLAIRQRLRGWLPGVATAVSLLLGLFLLMLLLGWIIAASSAGSGRVSGLAAELGIPLAPRPETAVAFGWGLRAVLAVLPALLTARITYPAMTLFLLIIIALVITLWQTTVRQKPADPPSAHLPPATPLPFVLLLILTGGLLTLGPEFVYLRDNFGVRLNTTFKFYYQAWVLFGVAALFALAYLWREAKSSAVIATLAYGGMFALSLLFPFHAVQSRALEYRGPVTAETRQPPTLNGLAYLQNFSPAEYEAIMWLRQNVEGTPVIVEAVGGQYSDYGRFAASTGLPTLLGWPGHEYQWRGDTPEPAMREAAVQQIYTSTDRQETTTLLNRYGVSYIIVGSRELNTYGGRAQEKFAELLPVAFSNEGVIIYGWQPVSEVP